MKKLLSIICFLLINLTSTIKAQSNNIAYICIWEINHSTNLSNQQLRRGDSITIGFKTWNDYNQFTSINHLQFFNGTTTQICIFTMASVAVLPSYKNQNSVDPLDSLKYAIIQIPSNYPLGNVTIYVAGPGCSVSHFIVIDSINAGIDDYQLVSKLKEKRYYNIQGQLIKNPDGIYIQENIYENGVIKRQKKFTIN